jgi:hypothetical protein
MLLYLLIVWNAAMVSESGYSRDLTARFALSVLPSNYANIIINRPVALRSYQLEAQELS